MVIKDIISVEEEIVSLLDREIRSMVKKESIGKIFNLMSSINIHVLPIPRYMEEMLDKIQNDVISEDFDKGFLFDFFISLRIKIRYIFIRYDSNVEASFKRYISDAFDIWGKTDIKKTILDSEVYDKLNHDTKFILDSLENEPWLFAILITLFYFDRTAQYRAFLEPVKDF